MSTKKLGRRAFLGKTAAGLLSTPIALPLLNGGSSSEAKVPELKYRTLGKTGLKVPIVSFGVMNSDSPDLLKKALQVGVKHFDTAHIYLRGNSEKAIGRMLQENGKRKEVYIATKMRFSRDREKHVFLLESSARGEPGATEENLRSQLDISLERLRTDYIDILYLHSCYSPEMATFEPLMKALVKVKEEGKARFIGISTHRDEPNVIRAAVDTGVYDVVLTAYNYLQKHREEIKKAIGYAADRHVGVVAMKTQGGVRQGNNENVEINHRAALKWVLNDKNVCTTIPGMTTFDQLELNFSLMSNLELTEEEKKDLELSSLMPGTLYCQNCRTCISTCPEKVEVPTLMRAYMYTEGYGNLAQAEMTASGLPVHLGLDRCGSCPRCTAMCQHGIPIEKRLKGLTAQGIGRC